MTNNKIEELLYEQNTLLKELANNIANLIDYTPSFVSLSIIAKELNKSNQTLRYHVTSHYEPQVDYKIQSGKIMINNRVLPLIRRHYEKK